ASFTAAAIVMRLLSPLVLRKLGKKKMLRISVALSLVVTAALGLADSMTGVFLLRMAQGVSFGLVSTISTALAVDFLPTLRQGEGMSYFGMGTTVMVAVAPTLGLFLSRTSGFQIMFLVASAGQILALLSLLFFRPPRGPGQAVAQPEEPKQNIFRSSFEPTLMLQCILLVFFGIGRSAEQNLLPLLAEVRGIDLALYFILQTAVSFCTKFFAGRLYDSKGRELCILIGCAALFIALIIMSLSYTLAVVLLAGFFAGLGVGFLQPSMQTWALTSVEQKKRSVASATYFNAYDVGMTLGALVLGAVPFVFGFSVTFQAAAAAMVIFAAVYLISLHKAKSRK
ncbi:MAG: MFS transporter, partial [Oscillospiraceae bacterium]|nr:MFS transporter [Oscillospiraceae bacterium]